MKIGREKAYKIAKNRFPSANCCFVGNLDEVWDHARSVHNVCGSMKNSRLDKTPFYEDEWGRPPGDILVNQKNEYWFVCLENHKHIWEQYEHCIINFEHHPQYDEIKCSVCGTDTYYSLYPHSYTGGTIPPVPIITKKFTKGHVEMLGEADSIFEYSSKRWKIIKRDGEELIAEILK